MMSTVIAVLAALVASFVVGMAWYGPIFGKKWMKYTKMKKKDMDKNMKAMMIKDAIVSIISLSALAFLILQGKPETLDQLVFLIIMIWIAFIIPSTLGPIIWENKPMGLGMINIFGSLLMFIVTGTVLMYLL